MKKTKTVPIWVLKAIEDDSEIDRHIAFYRDKGMMAEEDFAQVIDEIQDHCPIYTKHPNYKSYLAFKSKRRRKPKKVDVPAEVLDAVCDDRAFDDLYDTHMPASSGHKEAFVMTMNNIREYFPRFQRYSSHVSYVRARTYRLNGR